MFNRKIKSNKLERDMVALRDRVKKIEVETAFTEECVEKEFVNVDTQLHDLRASVFMDRDSRCLYCKDEIEAIKNYLGIDTVVVEGTHPYLEAVEWEEDE